MAAYLTPAQATSRLAAYDLDGYPSAGDLLAASMALNDSGPFIGARYAYDQGSVFPRSVTLAGEEENTVPDSVLDWVALRALSLSEEEPDAVQSASAGGVSVSFARPSVPRRERLMCGLLRPYQKKTGSLG